MRGTSIVLTVCAFLPCAASGQAPDATVRSAIRVEPADDACLGADALAAELDRLLSHGSIVEGTRVEVSIGDDEVRFLLHRDGQPDAEREFDVLPDACEARREAVALAIAIAIDHTVLERIAAPTESDSPAEETNGDEPAAEPPPPPRPPATRVPDDDGPSVRLGGFAGLVGALSVLPTASIGASLGARARIGSAELRIGAIASLPRRSTLGAGAWRTSLIAGRGEACLGTGGVDVDLGGCAGGLAGVVKSEGVGYRIDNTAPFAEPWLALAAGGYVRWPAGRSVSGRFSLAFVVATLRPRVQVRSPSGAVLAEGELPTAGVLAQLELDLGIP